MAVYTRISATDLTQYLSLFDIGTLVSFEGITDGVENTNYCLTTTQGRFILTLFEKRVCEEDLPFFISFMNYLRDKGIPCPGVIAAKTGTTVIPFNKKPAIITTFLQGQWPQHLESFHGDAVGTTLAKMHLTGKNFSMRRANSVSLPLWRDLIDKCGDRASQLEQGLFTLLQQELSYQEKNWPQHLPTGAVHADLFPDNVFFTGQEITGVIDFYFSCTESFAYDLMLTVNAWCFDETGQLDNHMFSEMLEAYQKKRPLTASELKALPFFGRAAALRIIATRLYDWLHPVPGAVVKMKDPVEYVRILQFYQTGDLPI
ncbi:MAG: homoserine kinase [Proteobacteria bacterium]|nr:homoserine kinase [Pseudomonadota bacterium]